MADTTKESAKRLQQVSFTWKGSREETELEANNNQSMSQWTEEGRGHWKSFVSTASIRAANLPCGAKAGSNQWSKSKGVDFHMGYGRNM